MVTNDLPAHRPHRVAGGILSGLLGIGGVQIVVGWPQAWTCTMIEDNVGAA